LALKGFLRRSQTALARSGPQKKRRTQVTRAAASGRGLATSEKLSAKARVDVIAVAKWISGHTPWIVYVERAQAFPWQAASSTFAYGRSGAGDRHVDCVYQRRDVVSQGARQAGINPKESHRGAHGCAPGSGAIEAAVALTNLPLVEAAVWKRKLRLSGKDKEAARQPALQLIPRQHALLARRKDHGRPEAALIVVAHLDAPR
jgi:hypothetical protein